MCRNTGRHGIKSGGRQLRGVMSFLNSSSRPHGVSESVWASIHCIVHIDSHSALLGTDVQQFLTKGPSVISHHLSHIFSLFDSVDCVFQRNPSPMLSGKNHSSPSFWPRASGWTRRELLAYHLMTFVMTNVIFFGFWFKPQFLKSPFSGSRFFHPPLLMQVVPMALAMQLQLPLREVQLCRPRGQKIM